MDILKAVWPGQQAVKIPQYGQGAEQDSVDLAAKALYYASRRVPLHEQYQPKSKAGDHLLPVVGISSADLERLDRLYNIRGFLDAVYDDEHRVLVDWPKNRFRAMLILSHYPQMESLPRLESSRMILRYLVLPADASRDEYIKTLSNSDLYREHGLPPDLRRELAQRALQQNPERTLEARAKVIYDYLVSLAVEVQVARLYKATRTAVQRGASPPGSPLASVGRGLSPMVSPLSSPFASPLHSPTHSRSTSPVHGENAALGGPTLRPTAGLRIPSPGPNPRASPVLRPRASHVSLSKSPERLILKPQGGDPRLSPTQRTASPRPPSPGRHAREPQLGAGQQAGVLQIAEKRILLQQARAAVKSRLDRERLSLLAMD